MNRYFIALLLSISLLAGCDHSSGSRSDQQVAADVQNKINADTSFPDKGLNVTANKGVVTLTGNVSSDAARVAAGNDAAQVAGVKTVVNNLVVANAAAAGTMQPPAQTQAASNPPVERAPEVKAKPSPRVSARAAKANQVAATASNTSTPPNPTTGQSSNATSEAPITPPDFQPGANTAAAEPAPAPEPQPVTVPSGTQISIRLTNELNSETAQVGDTFRGAISTPVLIDGNTVIPTTADVEGRVVDVKSAGRYAGQSDLVIELTRLIVNGNRYNISTDRWSKAAAGRGKATAAKVGGGAALGAVLGGIFGGGKGAAIGGAVGAGAGTGAASIGKGQQIDLKPETVLNFQLQTTISITPGSSNQKPLSSN